MNSLHLSSHAKLNWYLRVLDTRPDGYHNLETIFETLDIADDLVFSRLESLECRIGGFPRDVPAEKNLITRAWQLMRRHYPESVRGLEVAAEKRLPRGGGLGGGSSNAAAALLALHRLYDLPEDSSLLLQVAAELGSDVPFFIRGGCALAGGRGEVLQELTHKGSYEIILLLPEASVPTGEAYARLDAMRRPGPPAPVSAVVTALQDGDPEKLAPLIWNDFEFVVEETAWFRACREVLEKAGCLRAFLCGSGSTVAGLAPDFTEAKKILQRVHESCPCPAYHTSARALSLVR